MLANLIGVVDTLGRVLSNASLTLLNSQVSNTYGIIGNDIRDDTASIQAGLNANAGGTFVFAPGGTYKITSTITVPAGTAIQAWGATFDCSSSHFTAFRFVDGGSFLGATFNGASVADSYDPAGIAIACSGTNNTPAAPTYVKGPTISGCTFNNWGAFGIMLEYCEGASVDSTNKFNHIGYSAVGGYSCTNCQAINNQMAHIAGVTAPNRYGVFWSRHSGTETAEPRCYRCSASFNLIDDVPNWEAIDTHGGVDTICVGNVVTNCMVGIVYTSSDELAPHGGIIGSNILRMLGTGSGIVVTGALNVIPNTYWDWAEGITVSDNTIYDAGIDDNIYQGGIRAHGTKQLNVSGNHIFRPWGAGINLDQYCIGVNIVDNTIVDPRSSTVIPTCVRVRYSGTSGFIGSNIFQFVDPGLAAKVADQAIFVDTALTGISLLVDQNQYLGADATHLKVVSSSNPGFVLHMTGNGDPSGALACAPGSTFSRQDGGAGLSFYVKETANDGTGWVPK